MSNPKISLQALLDTDKIGKSDILQIQKILDKHPLNLTAKMNTEDIMKTLKTIVPELEAELKKLTGIDIKISDDAILKTLNQIGKETTSFSTNLKQMQEWLDLNTKTLQELKNALTSYQIALSNTDNADTSILSNIESIVTEIDKLKKLGTSLKNVGRGKMFPLIHCLCCKIADNNMCSLGY